jgi:hypothetical protein
MQTQPTDVLYDGQCEICQSCVSWLKALDHEKKTVSLPISAEVLSAVDSRLKMDECLRQLHVVPPAGEIRIGWDAVTTFRIVVPIVVRLSPGDRTAELLCHAHRARPCGATARSFIGMILLEDDELYQLVPDRIREGCRAFYRMLAPVPQSDSGTSVQSLDAILATEFCSSWLSMTTSMPEL